MMLETLVTNTSPVSVLIRVHIWRDAAVGLTTQDNAGAGTVKKHENLDEDLML